MSDLSFGVGRRQVMTRKKSKPLDVKRAVGIIRASTDGEEVKNGRRQQRQRNTPFVQAAAIEAWCAANGVELLAIFLDRMTGGSEVDDREGLLGALSSLRDLDAGLIVASKRDRAVRGVERSFEIQRLVHEHGAILCTADGVSSDNTPNGKLQRVLVDAFGEYEKDQIRQRVKDAVASKRARGEVYGVPTYGWQAGAKGTPDEGKLVPNPAEQEIIRLIQHLAEVECLSQRQIVEQLTIRGKVGRRGTPFQKTQIQHILARLTAEPR